MKRIISLFIILFLLTSRKTFNITGVISETKKSIWVNDTISNMSLDEKIGQMLFVYDYSTSMNEELENKLTTVKPGGFILFSENIESYKQMTKLIADIKKTNDIPLFIGIDEEGGRVKRIKNLPDKKVTMIPAMYQLGLTKDTALAYDVGTVVGEELRAFGINLNFAPVLDIYSNKDNTVIGNRAFSSTASIVSTMALSYSKGLKSTSIIPVYKHFPGHGDTKEDSHYTLPVIYKTKEELLNLELIPFIDAIEDDAQIIMIGHLSLPEITNEDTPATLSKTIVTDLLKEELNYDGLIITDGLNMKALTNVYTEEEIYIKALQAGIDILLMPTFDINTINIIKNAISDSEISEEQINESVTKILELKYEYLFQENKYDESYIGSKKHQEIIDKIPV